jgi:hypothetical protein
MSKAKAKCLVGYEEGMAEDSGEESRLSSAVEVGRFLVVLLTLNHDIGVWDTAISVVLWWGGQLADDYGIIARVLRVYLAVGG